MKGTAIKVFISILGILLIISSCKNEDRAISESEESPLIIETTRVSSQSIQPEYYSFGTLAASKTAQISASEEGRVESVQVEVGDAVEVGTILARIDASTLRNQLKEIEAKLDYAEARINIAQASLQAAEEEVEKMMIEKEILEIELEKSKMEMHRTEEVLKKKEALYEAEGISSESLSAFSAAANKARWEFKKTSLLLKMKSIGITPEDLQKKGIPVPPDPSNRLSQYKYAMTAMERGKIAEAQAQFQEVESLRQSILTRINESTIRSPIPGEVADVRIEIGELVTRGGTLFSVIDTSILDIEARIPVNELIHIHLNQEVLIRWERDSIEDTLINQISEAEKPVFTQRGRVRFITPFLEPTSQTAIVRCTLDRRPEIESPDIKENPLKPGDLVDLIFPYGEKRAYLLIPKDAVLEEIGEENKLVYQVRSHRLFPQTITPEFQWEDYYAISEGPQEGALLWKHPMTGIASGRRVEIAP